MKPTYEQAVEWAREAGMREGDVGDWTTADAALMYPECVYTENLERFAALAYEAGRKDENEANKDQIETLYKMYEQASRQRDELMQAQSDAIRARREQ